MLFRSRVVPWVAAGALVGKTLRDSGLREKFGLSVLGVRAVEDVGRKAALAPPAPERAIREGDTLMLVGEGEQLKRFMEQD